MKTSLFRTKIGAATAVVPAVMIAAFSYLPRPTDGAASAQKGGSAIYSQNCARCHGSNGRAQTTKGRQVKAVDLTSDDWSPDTGHDTRVVMRGKGSMPGFANKLTPAQITAVVEYIRRFK
jgi:mono/diheme cytochrome c family protein